MKRVHAWKRDPRKLKGGTTVLLCLKRQFADLRYGRYITSRLLRLVLVEEIACSIVYVCVCEFPFACARDEDLSWGLGPSLPLHFSRWAESLLPAECQGASYFPTTFVSKCVSCVARCSFADGTIYSWYSRIQISSCARSLASSFPRRHRDSFSPFVFLSSLSLFLLSLLVWCHLSPSFLSFFLIVIFFIFRHCRCRRIIHLQSVCHCHSAHLVFSTSVVIGKELPMTVDVLRRVQEYRTLNYPRHDKRSKGGNVSDNYKRVSLSRRTRWRFSSHYAVLRSRKRCISSAQYKL